VGHWRTSGFEGRQQAEELFAEKNGGMNMIAFSGTLWIVIAYLIAGWIGYQLGVERGMEKVRTKRRKML
jgi:hypothetical protein